MMMTWAGHAAHMGDMIKVYKILVRKPKGKITLRRGGGRLEGTISI
jgi:hypothetical protein